jgi:hypothetical protein
LFEDFSPLFDQHLSVYVNGNDYYKAITKVLEQNAQKNCNLTPSDSLPLSVIFSNFENVNPLKRAEFLSPELQHFLNTGEPVKTYSAKDLIFEDRSVNMEDCKKIVMARRDFFFCDNSSTRGDLTLLTWCRTPGYNLLENFRCDDVECHTLGPCLTKYGVVDLHNLSRLVIFYFILLTFQNTKNKYFMHEKIYKFFIKTILSLLFNRIFQIFQIFRKKN